MSGTDCKRTWHISSYALLIVAVIALMASVILIAIPSGNSVPDDAGTCGDDLTYSFYRSTGELSIKGSGEMYDGEQQWHQYKDDIVTVKIGNRVTSIGSDAFNDCQNLSSVILGNKLGTIGAYSFYYCSSLASLSIPDSVTTIEESAFAGCSSLGHIDMGKGITTINDYAFYACLSLESITIPGSTQHLGNYAFFFSTAIETVTIEDGVEDIGKYAFYYCTSITSLTIPKSVTSIGNEAFAGLTFKSGDVTVAPTAENLAGRTWTGSGDQVLYPSGTTF